MTTRTDAAARAICGYAKDDEPCEDCNGEAAAALAASDAVLLSDATVERAARAMFLASYSNGAWDMMRKNSADKKRYMRRARAVLAAAVKEDG